ncbi:NlpC/P60 family protein [Streptomyces sp. NPDC021020]|uniref:C40 family peptidase n=1 Tax=Streptomyces sp. NPDC021020 TaxID=3365109 RepID=UPI0037B2CAAC
MAKAVAAVLACFTLLMTLAAAGAASLLSPFTGTTSPASAAALSDIPPDYLTLYIDAAQTCQGLDWPVLAAIGKIESDHGRSGLPGVHAGANSAGAEGPMQFLPASFTSVTTQVSGGPAPSPYNPHDAIYAAATYLCRSGAPTNLHRAVYAYNHAEWYVSQVLTQAALYTSPSTLGAPRAAAPAALEALNYAQGQLGLPYAWGATGPTSFDCSGLTQSAYAAAGIPLPRTAQEQYQRGPHLPTDAPLLPGDLVFYGTPTHIHHVGLYIGAGQMIDAPHTGAAVRIEPYRYNGDDYAGATRPTQEVPADPERV